MFLILRIVYNIYILLFIAIINLFRIDEDGEKVENG